MANSNFAEPAVKSAALQWFDAPDFAVISGPDVAPGEPAAEQAEFGEVVLVDRVRAALRRMNPTLSVSTLHHPGLFLPVSVRYYHPTTHGARPPVQG
ncbi:MAG: hypothetical protein EXR51_08565 [Dehalococcoidia bacterium]|nr:hypothetical protein [Dehalococcoidia bacterium]